MIGTIFQLVLLLQLCYMAFRYKSVYRYMRHFRLIVLRDVIAVFRFFQLRFHLKWCQYNDLTVDQVFDKTAYRFKNKIFIHHEDVSWTFEEMSRYCNQVANALYDSGFRSGDEISLLMDNRPEFIGLWLACAKVGVVPALVNTNQKGAALVHAVSCVNSKALFFGTEHTKSVNDALELMQSKLKLQYFCLGEPTEDPLPSVAKSFEPIINRSSADFRKKSGKGYRDTLFYIYTSGTTGLPKASKIRHFRVFMAAYGLTLGMGLKHSDTLYAPLPFYHASGGILGTCTTIFFGLTMVSRRKFSASKYWTDCIKRGCTAGLYIGELCRYLCNQPDRPEERQHKVRILFGNGLRPNLWQPMKKRFGIKRIVEFFASTEGNTTLVNFSNQDGACGFIPQIAPDFILKMFYPVKLVRYDENLGQVMRDANGFCMLCRPGDVGMIVSSIDNSDPVKAFDGYANTEETKKKVLHNAFVKGDSVFMSGDLLYMDELGFLYFRDRTGDTFRWKGENVSTTEVETLISSFTHLSECVCFGVQLPGYEGRGCMIAIVEHPEHKLDLDYLCAQAKAQLPSYAVPLFVRIVRNVEYTSTYKLQKEKLKQQAFNVVEVSDPIYMLNEKRSAYIPLTTDIWHDIQLNNVRF